MSGKNLLKNPCGGSGMDGWEVTSDGGNGWNVEEKPEGCKPIKEANMKAKEEFCWATSHGECEKKQLIDLGACGFEGDVMDGQKPEIKISEWYGVRFDAGCKYWLKVRLLDYDKQELAVKQFEDSKDAAGGDTGEWYHETGSFTDYPDGVSFIEYIHGGQDNCCWAGHYGAKITCSSVKIDAKAQSSQSSSSSSSSSDDE